MTLYSAIGYVYLYKMFPSIWKYSGCFDLFAHYRDPSYTFVAFVLKYSDCSPLCDIVHRHTQACLLLSATSNLHLPLFHLQVNVFPSLVYMICVCVTISLQSL